MAKFIESALEDNGWMVKAIDDCGDNVGFGLMTINGPVLFLDNIHVQLKIRGKGIGKQLLDELIKLGVSEGACLLSGEFKPEFQEIDQVRRFYSLYGVEVTPTGTLYKDLS